VPLAPEETETLKRLKARLDASLAGSVDSLGRKRMGFATLDSYYNGAQVLEQLGLAVPDELRKFVTIVAWPGTAVDAIEERCDVEGFRLPGQPEADTGLSEVWQANDLDEESQMGHTDSLVFGRSYVCVGTGEVPELPLVTVESPLEMVHEWSPRDRETLAAARFYSDDSSGTAVARATLYTRMATIWLMQNDKKEWVEDPDAPRDDHNLEHCPVVPLINRGRSHDRYGSTEMARIITLTDAAARALTNAQVATELMALPQRWAAGMSQADFTDPETGELVTKWQTYFGAVWATPNGDAKFGQFSAADLGNFERIVTHYAQLVAGVTGLPMRYLGQLAANPPSAEGIKADEARLVKTCERKSRSWGASWERVMRLVKLFQDGAADPALASMETLWRDPSTPTRAQATDSAVKLFQAGIASKRQARRDVGYGSVQIANMELDDANNPDPVGLLAAEFRNANQAAPAETSAPPPEAAA
jgi:hypothetical protein